MAASKTNAFVITEEGPETQPPGEREPESGFVVTAGKAAGKRRADPSRSGRRRSGRAHSSLAPDRGVRARGPGERDRGSRRVRLPHARRRPSPPAPLRVVAAIAGVLAGCWVLVSLLTLGAPDSQTDEVESRRALVFPSPDGAPQANGRQEVEREAEVAERRPSTHRSRDEAKARVSAVEGSVGDAIDPRPAAARPSEDVPAVAAPSPRQDARPDRVESFGFEG